MSSRNGGSAAVRPALVGVVAGVVVAVAALVGGFALAPGGTAPGARAALAVGTAADPTPGPPPQYLVAPAASLAAMGQVPQGYYASDFCHYYQGQDASWYSDVCARTVPGTNSWGYLPRVGDGLPAPAFLVLFDTTEPQFVTFRFPTEAPFATNPNIGWLRAYPDEPSRDYDWLIRNNLDGQLYWLTPQKLQAELLAGHGPTWGFPAAQPGSAPGTVPGVTPGSAAANPANTAVLTTLTMQIQNARDAPANLGLAPRCTVGKFCF